MWSWRRLKGRIRCSLVLAATAFLLAPADAAADRPNIILIYTDDQAPGFTGFEGHPLVRTPHLDRLAEESVQFTRCYVPTPQCAPSRASLLTGQYPHSHGVTTNNIPLPLHADTFTARLKAAGYACGIVGKWHLPYETSDAPGFGLTDFVATDAHPWSWHDGDVYLDGEARQADGFLTDWHGDRAVEFVERFQDRPFFLWLSFRAPHAPLVYPPGTEELYPPDEVDLPATMNWTDPLRPNILQSPQSPITQLFRTMNEQQIRESRSRYYAMITNIDENVGRLLHRLDELELRDRTLVVFTSDNGWALGEHQLYSKGPAFYEELIRVPLLMRYPGLTEAGNRIDRIVSAVDLAPTFCEVAGVQVPMAMQGHSLLPVIRDPQTTRHADERYLAFHKQPAYSRQPPPPPVPPPQPGAETPAPGPQGQSPPHLQQPGQPSPPAAARADFECPVRGIVTPQYKLIVYLAPGQTDVFFDLKRDPQEMHNAIDATKYPEYTAVVKVLRDRLEHWRRETKDPTLK